MKDNPIIFGGVPTRKRRTAGKIADELSQVCDKVVVLSQGSEVYCNSEGISIIERDENIGMMQARNELFQMATEYEADYIIQSDDDLSFKAHVLFKMVEIMESEPALGALSSCPRVYANWEKDIISSKPFLVFQCPTQLWVIRMKALEETGFLHLDVLEDIELGLRMWKKGWVLGKIHLGLDYVHNPFIARINKDEDSGGQPVEYRRKMIPSSIKYMLDNHSDVVQSMGIPNSKTRTYHARYDWYTMCSLAKERWGTIGYQDSKGRFI